MERAVAFKITPLTLHRGSFGILAPFQNLPALSSLSLFLNFTPLGSESLFSTPALPDLDLPVLVPLQLKIDPTHTLVGGVGSIFSWSPALSEQIRISSKRRAGVEAQVEATMPPLLAPMAWFIYT